MLKGMLKRERYSASFKAKVALETLKGRSSIREISEQFGVSVITLEKWKREFMDNVKLPFSQGKESSLVKEREEQIACLERKVGNLTMERDFLYGAYKKAGLK